jgi:predicted lipoprotein with Yx(FWY)xxD motif
MPTPRRFLFKHGRHVAGSAYLDQGYLVMKSYAAVLWMLSAGLAWSAPIAEGPSPFGKVLVADNQMTLYTFTKDTPGVSTCDTTCTEHWPPLVADEKDAPFERYTVIERADQSYQWAADGKPLYFYWEDQKPGDTLGEGRHGTWAVARP